MFTLVAGTGYTGSRVLEQIKDGAGLSRSPKDLSKPNYVVDFDTISALPLTPPDPCNVLYTCPPGDARDTRLQRFLSLLEPVPSRFVYISTTGVYGDCQGAVVTEESPLKPESRMSRPRVAAETLLADWARENDVALVILRAPGIYGPGRLGLDRLQTGAAYLDEDDAHPGNRIHVDDLAASCLAALSDGVPAGIYNIGDGDHRSATWFGGEVARQAGLPAPRTISRAAAEKEFSPARLAFMSASRIVDTTKMRDVLGVSPRTPEQGIGDSLGL